MKRFFVFLGVLLLLAAVGQTKAFAVSEEEIYKQSGASTLEGHSSGTSLQDSAVSTLKSALTGGAANALKYGAFIVAALLVISVMNGIKQLKAEDISGGTLDFVSAAALVAACFPALYSVFNYAAAAIDSFCDFSASLLPVTASLYAMGGNNAQAVAASGGFSLFLSVTELVNARILLPLLSLGVALALTGLLPGSEHIAPAASVVKNWCCVLIAFVFSLVGYVFYFQTAVAASADTFSYRAAKFASGSFIPVIGGAVGDSARTVFGAVSSVKASVGTLGLCVMLAYVLPPLVSALLYKAMFSFCAFFAKLCGLEKQGKFLTELGGMLGACLALLISCGAVFTVISAVFLKSGVSA